ncbi:Dabb family protein [Emticicia sp. CRIBPO]|uniref:Dabb family protein n=1 Tax=Emticicia sp. CRIBPO TaxID=2683258 RepID=UPI001412B1D9|nr:Dabb family protein [Emticicia sp. CRIBPO]NBA85735.1 Dabb family protein [Emticicia sp. CRIBPO]
MIRHSVILKLKHTLGSQEEQQFFDEVRKLEAIPGVKNFEILRQTSPKSPFDFGISMEFDNQELYDGYSSHPDHVYFVEQFWKNEVTDFQEIDYIPY